MDVRKYKIFIASLTTVVAMISSGCVPGMGEAVVNQDIGGTAPPPNTSNSSPVISGIPSPSIIISNAYTFTPSATDPDGDTLTFSVQNKPLWADFDTVTGALTGMPQLGDIGSYTNIDISVSDGDLSSGLPQFSVDVVQNADGSITLSWTAPTANDDSTPLTNLAAYKFYYGTSPGSYSDQIRIDNPGLSTYVIENLTPATYYIVATAVNSAGVESRFSNEAVKQIL